MEAVVQQGLVEVMFAAAHESGFGRQLSAPHQTCQLSRVQETGSPSEQRDDFMRAFDPEGDFQRIQLLRCSVTLTAVRTK